MLAYHPAYDAHHAAFRILVLLTSSESRSVPVDLLRILDFFFLFPDRIETIRFPSEYRSHKKRFRDSKSRYSFSGENKLVFEQMYPLFLHGCGLLASTEIVNVDRLQESVVAWGETPVPASIDARVHSSLAGRGELIETIWDVLGQIPLGGRDGLKDRTGLLEFRYDAV